MLTNARAGAAGGKETSVALATLRPEDENGVRRGSTTVGGEKFDDALVIQNYGPGTKYDTGQGYDLLEGFIGLPEAHVDWVGNADTLTIRGDGNVLAQFALNRRDRVRFISCPLNRLRMVELAGSQLDGSIAFIKVVLIRGRTQPSRPTDFFYTPGQPEYIPAGWYNIRPR